jgi:hypothetical protein
MQRSAREFLLGHNCIIIFYMMHIYISSIFLREKGQDERGAEKKQKKNNVVTYRRELS